jgi:hypothetical protein
MDERADISRAGRNAEALLALAAWYRSWAEVAGSMEERERRLRLAAQVEATALSTRPPSAGGSPPTDAALAPA